LAWICFEVGRGNGDQVIALVSDLTSLHGGVAAAIGIFSISASGFLIQTGVNLPSGVGQAGKAGIIPARPFIAMIIDGVFDWTCGAGTLVRDNQFAIRLLISGVIALDAIRHELAVRRPK